MKTIITINQRLPLANEPDINFKVMQETIFKNSAEGSQLSIFPEDFLYGVLRNRSELISAGRLFDVWVNRFCELAKQYNIDIIPGTFPSIKDSTIRNTAVYIDRTGKVLTEYSKNNLWLSERDEYESALQLSKVFNSVLGKSTIIICWDIFDHRLIESAIRQGAEWIIVLAFWSVNQSGDLALERGVVQTRYRGFSDSKMLDSLIQSRVCEYNVGLVFCNFAGKHDYTGLIGPQVAVSANRSQVVLPYSNVLYRASNRKEVTLKCELPSISQAIADFEIHYGRRQDISRDYPWGNIVS